MKGFFTIIAELLFGTPEDSNIRNGYIHFADMEPTTENNKPEVYTSTYTAVYEPSVLPHISVSELSRKPNDCTKMLSDTPLVIIYKGKILGILTSIENSQINEEE